MSLDNISQFLSAIDRAGELTRISEPVKARLELCEIADRVMKQPGGGNALFFENVILDNGERSQYPVVINLFGSMRRMSLALGVENLDDVGERITEMLDLKVPEGILGKLSMLPRLLELGKFPPRVRSGKAVSQEVVVKGDDVDLSKLPMHGQGVRAKDLDAIHPQRRDVSRPGPWPAHPGHALAASTDRRRRL